MAENNSTIIVANLEDSELRKSIESLVAAVNQGTQTMASSFDNAITRMSNSLRSFTKEQKNATDITQRATKKRIASYDQEAQAIQKATGRKKNIRYDTIQSDVDPTLTYLINVNKNVDQQLNEIIQKEQRLIEERKKEEEVVRAIAQAQGQLRVAPIPYTISGDVHNQTLMSRQTMASSNAIKADTTAYSELEKTIAGLLNIKVQEVNLTTNANSSYNALNASLKQMTKAYQEMNAEERASKNGVDLANRIQRTTRSLRELQSQMNRPTNLQSALGLEEKSIDQIAYKIQQLNAYKRNLDTSNVQEAQTIRQVTAEVDRLTKKQNEWLGKNQSLIASQNALTRSLNYMKNRLAFYFTVGASTMFVKNLIDIRSQYEMNERALGILINSAERGSQVFNELSQMALVSPYTLIELSSAAKQLVAYDIAAKDVVNTTRRLADMASAVGVPIERLTYALGQIKAYGYLNSRDARMFANAGIPLVKELSNYYTDLEGRLVTIGDVYDRIKKKTIDYNDVMQVVNKMTDEGGKFFDFQAKMADTLKVRLANLTLAWNNMLNDIGRDTQGVLTSSINTLKNLFLHWKEINSVLTQGISAYAAYRLVLFGVTRLMGASIRLMDSQILARKRSNATMLEKQALTRKLTIDEQKLIATQKTITATDYQNTLSGKALTKQQALLLVAIHSKNTALKAAIVNMGVLTTREVENITTGKALSIVFKSIVLSIRSAANAMKSFVASNWLLLTIGAITEGILAWNKYHDHVKELNESSAQHAKEVYNDLKSYLESDAISSLRNQVFFEPETLSETDALKAWDEMRDKIENASQASNSFIAKLMEEDDLNKRLGKGFDYLKDLERVAGIMQSLPEDAIKLSSTVVGGIFGEGLKDDLKDYIKAFDAYQSLNKELQQGYVGEEAFNKQRDALREFREEIQNTTNSIYDVSFKSGFNTNEQREFLERQIGEIAQKEQLSVKETRILRMNAEREYYEYARTQLLALAKQRDGVRREAVMSRIKELDEEFGVEKSMQESFFAWVSETHANEVRKRFGNMTKEEIAHIDWSQPKWKSWAEKLSKDFSQEYGVSFNDLYHRVLQANTWTINIPVFFQTIGEPLSSLEQDYERRTGRKMKDSPDVKDAKSQVEIIETLKKRQKEASEALETARKAGGKYWEENKENLESINKQLIEDIHSYNALTDAEEKSQKQATKGAKKDPLGDAIQKEVQLIGEIQKRYKEYKKMGVDTQEALKLSANEYNKSLLQQNAILSRYGLNTLSTEQLATMPLQQIRDFYKEQLTGASASTNGVEALEKAIANLNVEITKIDYEKITKGLNNELSKLKDEYELAVELDANPEVGNAFLDMMGIDPSTLPQDVEAYAKEYTNLLNKYLKESGSSIELPHLYLTNDDIRMLEEMSSDDTLNEVWVENIKKGVDEVRKVRKKDIEDTMKDWEKLLEKYAEYEVRRKKIQDDAEHERQVARKKGASQEIMDAINNRENQELAQLDFEQFKRAPEWISATGDIANMTRSALGMLIDELENYKKTAKNLTPKQIKEINKALRTLYKEQRKRNPFHAIGDAISEAKARMEDYDEEIKDLEETKKKWDKQTEDGIALTAEESEKYGKLIKRLKELKEHRNEVGKIDASSIVQGINDAIQVASQATQQFTAMADALGGKGMTYASKVVSGVMQNLQAAGAGAAMGAQIGGGWGAAIGAIAGGLMDAFTQLADIISGDAKINNRIKVHELEVKRLDLAYKNLEYSVNQAYGTAVVGAQQAVIANKKLQLAELERQLSLEMSRKQKNKDDERILELKGEIVDLKNEINDAINEVTNNLLGISSVGDAVENMVGVVIDALRNGENAIDAWNDSIDDMIVNMIKKFVATKMVAPLFEKAWDEINDDIQKRSQEPSDIVQRLKAERQRYYDTPELLGNLGVSAGDKTLFGIDAINYLDRMIAEAEEKVAEASSITRDDLEKYIQILNNLKAEGQGVIDYTNDLLEQYGLKDGGNANLSALQQGIKGITEDQAGALEAYWNANTQQQYLQSDLLTQIRNAVVGFDIDVQTATQAQMLLQLQQSYQVQMSIQSILEGWSSANGLAVKVEMI